MSIISAGTSVTTALTHTADRTGRLVFQTNGTTTALTLDSSQDAAFVGNLTISDNNKIMMGAGEDLQLYHDGSHSYIDDAGTGNVYLRSNGAGVVIANNANVTMARFLNGNAVDLYFNGDVKLATTSTGVNITGDLTVNGAPVGRTPLLKSSSYTASNGEYVVATAGGITITLPASPSTGDYVEIHDGTGAAATSNITVGRNGESVAGAAEDFTLDVNYAKLHMVYVGGSVGWTV